MSGNDRVLDTFSALYFLYQYDTLYEDRYRKLQPPKDKLLCVTLFIETLTIIAAIFRRDLLA